MSRFWRPLDVPSDTEEDLKLQQSKEKNERMKIRVTEHEKKLILDAYNAKIGQGWDDVVHFVKHNVEKFPLNSRVVEYYLNGEKEKVKRRMKRIVNEALKEASSQVKMPGVGNDAKNNVAEETVQRHMRYAHKRTPLQRKEDKMGHFQDPNDESSEDDEDETQTLPPKKKSLREMTADAQEAHQKMCQQAMASMDMMNNVMTKLNRKLDDM